MKCVVYVSKVSVSQGGGVVPVGLSGIFRTARTKNANFNITGLLSYKNGRYIQILEGGEDNVNQLIANIMSDPRHEDMQILMDFRIEDRSFAEFGMKLVTSLKKETPFIKFVEKYFGKLKRLHPKKRELFGHFYPLDNSRAQTSNSYIGKSLMLSAWPDFNLIKQSPVIIELCGQLTLKACSYDKVLKSGRFGTQQQLDSILNKFEILEILKVTNNIQQTTAQISVASNDESSSNFYSKMKNFLQRK